MLRVTLEVVPFGDEKHKRTIGQLDIFNVGCPEREDGQTNCWYGVMEITGKSPPGLYKQQVYHMRQKGAWELVRNVLSSLGIGGP